MKKWSLILALFLCLIAVGGIAVIFRNEDSTPSDNKNDSTGGSSQEYEVDGIDLNETNLIFEEMRLEFVKKYPISITFINKINLISEKAHTKKLGWEIIDEFEFNHNHYIGLAFDMKNSVIK